MIGSDATSSTFSDTFTKVMIAAIAAAAFPNGAAFMTGDIALNAWLQYNMPDAEAIEISRNPMNIFEPFMLPVHYELAAVGGFTIPLYYHRTMHGMS